MFLDPTMEFTNKSNIMADFNQRANFVPCYLLIFLILWHRQGRRFPRRKHHGQNLMEWSFSFSDIVYTRCEHLCIFFFFSSIHAKFLLDYFDKLRDFWDSLRLFWSSKSSENVSIRFLQILHNRPNSILWSGSLVIVLVVFPDNPPNRLIIIWNQALEEIHWAFHNCLTCFVPLARK